MAYLIVDNGTDAGRQHALTRARYVLGRHPDCDIVVDVGAVSRHHAQLLRVGDNFYLEDLNSRNGTFVNDQPIFGRHRLAGGDRIRVCDILFTFHGPGPADNTDDHSRIAVLIDDPHDSSISTIMSKLEVGAEDGALRVHTSADAKLQALLEITRSLGRSLSLDQVLPQVLNSLFKIFLQADRGFVVLRDQDGELVPRWTKLRHENTQQTLRLSRTIVHHVMETKQAILSADAAADVRFEMSESIADFRIRSMICAPLINSERDVIGFLQVDTLDQRNRFRPEDLEVLVSVATQAAIAIDNAQLHERALRQREVQRDLELAREVQNGFLPESRPQVAGYEFFDFYEPANHVGGDYYDYVLLPSGRIAILVGDVVGHGIAAALLMSKLSATVRFAVAAESQPARAMQRLNDTLLKSQLEDRFITLIMAVLDPHQHRVTLVNAGHMPPLLRRGRGRLERPSANSAGLPLLVSNGHSYRQTEVNLQPGDLLVLFTDGLNEAIDDQGNQYGVERLRHLVLASQGATNAGQQIVDDMHQFVGGRPVKDDRCLVCFSRL